MGYGVFRKRPIAPRQRRRPLKLFQAVILVTPTPASCATNTQNPTVNNSVILTDLIAAVGQATAGLTVVNVVTVTPTPAAVAGGTRDPTVLNSVQVTPGPAAVAAAALSVTVDNDTTISQIVASCACATRLEATIALNPATCGASTGSITVQNSTIITGVAVCGVKTRPPVVDAGQSDIHPLPAVCGTKTAYQLFKPLYAVKSFVDMSAGVA